MAHKRPHPRTSVEEAARLFHLLGDPARLRILLLLRDRGEAHAGDLTAVAGLPRTATVYHLMLLRRGGVVERRRAGRRFFYRITSPLVAKLVRAVEEG
jgi:ArsR family transcriptional regulator, lead/cadmium/zinc/bismuth-responsive transcriptional repressor